MAEIKIDHVRHAYDGDLSDPAALAIKGIDHRWQDGGAYALLGPSGCGKSTMLNIISGLVRPTAGRIFFGDRDVTDLPTEDRNIAQVFQFPVLYDSMSVYDNLAFPLRNRGVDRQSIARRVNEVADMLGLLPALKKKASGLSAADKQKISLGRGLVREDVAAILFDEPLTVIDPHVKYDLRRKLKMIHQATKRTLIYVTHDQTEAMTFADKVVVMSEGEVVQMGTPQELYERPSHTFVGSFIGSPPINLMPCTVGGGQANFSGGALPLPQGLARGVPKDQPLVLGVRPRGIRPADAGENGVRAHVQTVERRGASRLVEAMVGEHRLRMDIPDGRPIPEGAFQMAFDPSMTLLFANNRLVGAFDE
jgi:glycerol transport system ATP-binding protein